MKEWSAGSLRSMWSSTARVSSLDVSSPACRPRRASSMVRSMSALMEWCGTVRARFDSRRAPGLRSFDDLGDLEEVPVAGGTVAQPAVRVGRIGHDVLAIRRRDRCNVRGRLDGTGIEVVEPLEVREDVVELLGERGLFFGAERQAREQRDMAHVVVSDRHERALTQGFLPINPSAEDGA